MQNKIVSWQASGTVWYGRIKFVKDKWVFVMLTGSEDPKAFIPKNHIQCLNKDEVKEC